VVRSLRSIEEGVLDRGRVGDLAERLRVGERHLRRLFVDHVGASPLAVARTRRFLFAKRLIDESGVPTADLGLRRALRRRRTNAGLSRRDLATVARLRGPVVVEHSS
jgi:AraC family transcriptional regulator of adaptative response / DNA-3-methyladenine glycosylase II